MSESPTVLTPTVAVIGGGPAGLSAAKRLARAVDGEVLVLEREREAGGIPRHADHRGYGIRDRRRFMSGPAYAKALVAEAERAGARIVTRAMVTGWADERTLAVTTPHGLVHVRPDVFCFATGARERPRAARLIPGTRPAGVLTTGQLQNLVHVNHEKVGTRAVVVGAELVSWSAVMTLAEAGCRTEALVTEQPKGESYWLFREPGKLWFRTRVVTGSRVVAIHGRPRVTGVEVEDVGTGKRRVIACDTVVFTGDWIADHELLRMAGVEMDGASTGPVVDTAMRTSRDGVFAVGNVNHPVETADVVALEGEAVAERILEHLRGERQPAGTVRLTVAGPLRWVTPARYAPDGPPPARGRLVAWVDRFVAWPVVTVEQDGREVARRRLWWPAAPGRAFRIPSTLLRDVDATGGDVRISVG
ncbi:pyridine nucleotide-disulfide oxidoreductase [Georgenia sp. 311]|uniref:NAD(P)/FAD-dependent oxidoreductase n=1 Tax=Georgenia sp. 311 TaxID=2585134 RepID=UPI0011127916|nr:FAD-dependent oxidoreductase [Georgenia sp. 311]TNC20784.1 pyridine nucleotide-disulfide oxidoreductase [Georgenia sp. 311]